jgi:hypothetical protein
MQAIEGALFTMRGSHFLTCKLLEEESCLSYEISEEVRAVKSEEYLNRM